MVLNETRSVDLLVSTAATRRSENGVVSCTAGWKFVFVIEGINGSERVTRAPVRFIYLCGARKGDFTGARSILASRAFRDSSSVLYSSTNLLKTAKKDTNSIIHPTTTLGVTKCSGSYYIQACNVKAPSRRSSETCTAQGS